MGVLSTNLLGTVTYETTIEDAGVQFLTHVLSGVQQNPAYYFSVSNSGTKLFDFSATRGEGSTVILNDTFSLTGQVGAGNDTKSVTFDKIELYGGTTPSVGFIPSDAVLLASVIFTEEAITIPQRSTEDTLTITEYFVLYGG